MNKTNILAFPLSFFYFFSISVATLCCILMVESAHSTNTEASAYEIHVHAGDIGEIVEYFKSKNFWGEATHQHDLDVPRSILVAMSNRWESESEKIPVEVKKELFYRAIIPLVLLSNELILKERETLLSLEKNHKQGAAFKPEELEQLQALAEKYGVEGNENPEQQVIQLLGQVDKIPPSLALGQTAYESGYGTSRFAVEGNALFGQWTYAGKGMKPKEHRKSKGNYGVAAYKWPFDSVRSYMFNLNTHKAYQALRDKRLAVRKQGKEPTGLQLAETLISYSEKGEEYVKTLKGIIAANGLEITDKAYLRKELVSIIVGVKDKESVAEAETELTKLRASGELDRIIKSMLLNGKSS